MTREDYVSYEVAKLLKEKEFDGEVTTFVEEDNTKYDYTLSGFIIAETLPCPTHQMAMKWLRKNNIIVIPQPEYFSCDKCESWGIDIWAGDNYEKLSGDFPTYEQAVEAALKYCLTHLI